MFRIPRYESPMLATPEIPTFLDRRELLGDCRGDAHIPVELIVFVVNLD